MNRIFAIVPLVVHLLAGAVSANEADSSDWTSRDRAVIERSVASPARPAADRTRDAGRQPVEVLSFFQIKPGMRVADVMAGTGYYTEIVSRVVGPTGRVYWHNNNDKYKSHADAALQRRLQVADLPNVERSDSRLGELRFPDQPLDAVLLFLFYHDTYLIGTNRDAMNKAVYDSLKPGGLYCIIDHDALPGTAERDTGTLHRVEGELVKAEVVSAGFALEAESDVLRNSQDDRRTLVYRPDMRGKTDRFVYRFRKPLK